MEYIVKEAFHTSARRFVAGQKVIADDLAGPVPVQRWIDMKKIEPVKPPKPVRAPAPDITQ